jgi:Na+(H+)/acetate symporter ActP
VEDGGGRNIADICGLVAFYLAAAAILPSVVFAITRKWEIAKGTGFGSFIGLALFLITFIVASVLYD